MLVGHKKQWQFLVKTAELERLPHAFLFSGPSQVGKKTLALEFIKFLNCKNKEKSNLPCHVCENCRDIDKRVYPDLHIIKPGGRGQNSSADLSGKGRTSIQISQIRELNWRLSLHSYKAEIKTVVIDQAHTMTQDAQSAFLKMLEEPRGETLFILITEIPERLLLTILSRCERIRFHSVPQDEIEDELRKRGVLADEARDIARFSFGKPGLALNYLLNPKNLIFQKRVIKEIAEMETASVNLRFKYAKELSQKPKKLKGALDIWLRYFRGLLLKVVSGNQPTTKEEQSNFSSERLVGIIKLLQKTIFLLSNTNINPRLALEILLLEV